MQRLVEVDIKKRADWPLRRALQGVEPLKSTRHNKTNERVANRGESFVTFSGNHVRAPEGMCEATHLYR